MKVVARLACSLWPGGNLGTKACQVCLRLGLGETMGNPSSKQTFFECLGEENYAEILTLNPKLYTLGRKYHAIFWSCFDNLICGELRVNGFASIFIKIDTMLDWCWIGRFCRHICCGFCLKQDRPCCIALLQEFAHVFSIICMKSHDMLLQFWSSQPFCTFLAVSQAWFPKMQQWRCGPPLRKQCGSCCGWGSCRCLAVAPTVMSGTDSTQILMAATCSCIALLPWYWFLTVKMKKKARWKSYATGKWLGDREVLLPYALCRTMRPDQYVALLYWLASDAPYKTCKKEANVTQAMWSKAVARLRSILWLRLCKDSEQPLGGPGKVVCIDERFICKKKRSRGGFQGRSTSGTKQIILGMIELDLETRKATGRIFLSTIPDRSQKTLRKHIQKQVLPGTLLFMLFCEERLPTTCTIVSTTRPGNSLARSAFLVMRLWCLPTLQKVFLVVWSRTFELEELRKCQSRTMDICWPNFVGGSMYLHVIWTRLLICWYVYKIGRKAIQITPSWNVACRKTSPNTSCRILKA